jgi:hypothetical protein
MSHGPPATALQIGVEPLAHAPEFRHAMLDLVSGPIDVEEVKTIANRETIADIVPITIVPPPNLALWHSNWHPGTIQIPPVASVQLLPDPKLH